jgi:hypothetical protein
VGRSRTKLKAEEETVLVKQLLFMGSRGFPHSQKTVREEATKILRARCEREHKKYVPLGKRWPTAFMFRHSDQLQMYWSSSLPSKRAKSLNIHTLEGWQDLQEQALQGDFSDGTPILSENIANFDETGWVPSVRTPHRVIGAVGQKHQYEMESGMRENITIMCTVMADGTSTRPIVIFKGANVQSCWGVGDKNHNIANAQ